MRRDMKSFSAWANTGTDTRGCSLTFLAGVEKFKLKSFTGLYEDKTLEHIIFALDSSPEQHNLA